MQLNVLSLECFAKNVKVKQVEWVIYPHYIMLVLLTQASTLPLSLAGMLYR